MTNQNLKHVYLLGAGFSRPLGGPLFTEVFTQSMTNRLMSQFPILANFGELPKGSKRSALHALRFVHLAFDRATEFFGGSVSSRENVLNPETFLEYCDSCERGRVRGLARALFNEAGELADDSFGEETKTVSNERSTTLFMQCFNTILRTRLALETSQFLHEIDPESERWKPYDSWFEQLCESDVIITTNYDCVVETLLFRKLEKLYRGSSQPHKAEELRSIVFPQAPKPLSQYQNDLSMYGCPRIYKLHGSSNWWKNEDLVEVRTRDSLDDFLHESPLVGVPGIGKDREANGPLREHWRQAFLHIRDAEVMSIIGYSMPASDSSLRMKLLDEFAREGSRIKEINVVLGPVSNEGRRAREIIQQAVSFISHTGNSPRNVRLLNVYGQDFLPKYVPRSDLQMKMMQFDCSK